MPGLLMICESIYALGLYLILRVNQSHNGVPESEHPETLS